ncbi:MAG: hypothetical protein EA424_04985 [Planctomycetaceae bacterium]|nr:MAG: hypothetical protein EA424_04985 [Planctomycetaceae bacterium]
MGVQGRDLPSKVHSDFYRLSEDLDFAYSVPLDAPRSQRRMTIEPSKEHLTTLAQRLACFHVGSPLRGHNNSTQYLAELRYRSAVTGQDEAIKVEFSIREPILEPVEFLPARTLLVDPFRQSAAVGPVSVPTLSLRETYAEKFRAALTRREPAIRDFFDLDHAVRSGRLNAADAHLFELVRQKLTVRGNASIDVSDAKREVLKCQVQAQLRPVLREADFGEFDLDRAFETVAMIARTLA